MKEALLIYIIFGIGITCSKKTNLMYKEAWYLQLLHVVAYPVIIFYMVVKYAWLTVQLTEAMDEQKNSEIALRKRVNDLDSKVFPPIIPVDIYSKHWNGDDEIFALKGFDGKEAFNNPPPVEDGYDVFDFRIGSMVTFDDYSSEAFLISKIEPHGYHNEEGGCVVDYVVEAIGGKNGTWVNPLGLINGIPITPIILDALLIVDTYRSGNTLIYEIPCPGHTFQIEFDRKGFTLMSVKCGSHEYFNFRFIHQLQNFYHAVSGGKKIATINEGTRKAVSKVLLEAQQNPMHNVEETN